MKEKIKKDPKKIVAVVVNWNGKQFLYDCFSTLSKQDYKNYEIVMVDNASTDDSVEYVKKTFPKVKIINSPSNRGFGAAVNLAINATKSDYIIFLNNDVSFKKNFLSELAKTLEPNDVGGVSPKILLYDRPNIINYAGGIVNYLGYTWPKYAKNKDRKLQIEETPFGGILMFKREILKKIGVFDELFFLYHEDSDLCWRIRLAGYKILFNPNAVMYHKYDFKRNNKKMMFLEKNRLLLITKNYSTRTLIILFPIIIFSEVASIGYSLINGWVLDKLKSYIHMLQNLPEIIRKRKRIKDFRKIPDKEFTKPFVGDINYIELKNPIIKYLLSPVYNKYWQIAKSVI